MTNDVEGDGSPTKKSGARGIEKYVIGILILGFAAGIFYQVFFCSTCYGLTQRFVPAAEKTAPK